MTSNGNCRSASNAGTLPPGEPLRGSDADAKGEQPSDRNTHRSTKHMSMKATTQTVLRAAAVVGVAFGLCATALTAADAPSNPIKEAMQKYNKAPKDVDPICKRAGAGQATKEELAGMLAAYKAMAATKPPQGDPVKFAKLCATLVEATAALEKGEAGAAEKFKAAVNCKACHEEFKPKAKK